MKDPTFRGVQEKQYRGGIALKGGAWTVCRFVRGLGKKEGGGVFERGWYPNAHYESGAKFEEKLIFCFKNDKNLVKFDLSSKT